MAARTATEAPRASAEVIACRLCAAPLQRMFVDLGSSPLANSYLTEAQLLQAESFYPLRVFVCEECLLVQLPVFERPEEIFTEYAYFSSYSESWVEHARRYADAVAERFGLDSGASVVEVASNDGYLLQFFRARGMEVLGIEPAGNVAAVAIERGIPTLVEFFGTGLAQSLRRSRREADLIVGNNVLAHVPDVHDFVAGLELVLAPEGVITMEFPHLLHLMRNREFDTIYHEHFSYFAFMTAERLFADHGLTIFDVDELPTHGGSLRIYACHEGAAHHPGRNVARLRDAERSAGLDRLETYETFEESARASKRDLLAFLIEAKRRGKSTVAYGAAAKGNTLLNYCGIRSDLVDYVVDRSPHKQGRFLPGTHLEILSPERVRETRPDYLLILPWNLEREIVEQMAHVREFGCRFVVPIPTATVLP